MKKKFRRALLHFGSDKTGTTAIQSTLDLGRQKLLEGRHLAYPPGRWHAELGSYFCDAPERFILNITDGAADRTALRNRDRLYFENLERWLGSIEGTEVLVFSYEGFLGLDSTALTRFREYCLRWSERVDVLVYARPPLSYAISAMSQRATMGDDPARLQVQMWRSLLSRISNVFGVEHTMVRVFSSNTMVNGDVVDDFFAVCGVPQSVTMGLAQHRGAENRSLSWQGLKVATALRDGFASKAISIPSGTYWHRLGRHLGSIAGDPIRLTASQAREVLARAKEEIEYLAKTFGVNLVDDPKKHIWEDRGDSDEVDGLLGSIGGAISEIAEALITDPVQNFALQKVTSAIGIVICERAPVELLAGSINKIPLTIHNNSTQDWVSTPAWPINVSYRWSLVSGKVVENDGLRTPLPNGRLNTGNLCKCDLAVRAPDKSGEYLLVCLPVQEGWAWFDSKGFKPLQMKVFVK